MIANVVSLLRVMSAAAVVGLPAKVEPGRVRIDQRGSRRSGPSLETRHRLV